MNTMLDKIDARLSNIENLLAAPPTEGIDILLNLFEASEYLNVSISHVLRLVSNKQLVPLQKGRILYFPKTALSPWKNTGKKEVSNG